MAEPPTDDVVFSSVHYGARFDTSFPLTVA
jgi:hypothetical protein